MTDALGDLIFWIAVLIGLFFLLRYLQKKKNQNDKD